MASCSRWGWVAVLWAGLGLHLASLRQRKPDELASGPTFIGNVIVAEDAKIGANCVIGPDVSIGIGCVIGEGVRLVNSVLLHRVQVSICRLCLKHGVHHMII